MTTIPPRFLIVIAGPTAVGKTDMTIHLAKHFDTHIISADSRQLFRELKIGTAAPLPEQLAAVPHHLVANLSITDYYNIAMYENDALQQLDELFKTHQCVIISGGSGLYIDTVLNGVDDMPAVDPEVRDSLNIEFQQFGLESLRAKLEVLDPISYNLIDLQNPKRVIKALEVSIQTGKPYSSFLTGQKKERPFHAIRICLNRPRPELYQRIDERVIQMIEQGLEAEVRQWNNHRELNALNTVGYKEWYPYFDGESDYEEVVRLIQRNTRRYAKRQLTWWGRDKRWSYFHPSDIAGILAFIKKEMEEIK